MARTRNERLAAVISEAEWTQAQVATQFVRVAREIGATNLLSVGRTNVSQWVLGSKPSGPAASILCETLSRGLGRRLTPSEIGLTDPDSDSPPHSIWHVDTLAALNELRSTQVALARRQFLSTSAYSVAGLALPEASWWQDAADRARSRPAASSRRIGAGDVEAVQEMTGFFQKRDQRRGGGHGRSAVTAYLVDEVAGMLNGTFRDENIRRELLSTAGELIYLMGWMAFDAGQHAEAQTHFSLAIRLAAEATDPALAAHVMRAMAHQAVDLGHYREALQLSSATMDRSRYNHACPRERALLGVVHARALAVTGQKREAAAALLKAEGELSSAAAGDEPGRVFFFKEASLAHETACTLRDIGDFAGAQREFKRSVRTRKATVYARTHAVTLGYLGAVQARTDGVEAACATWSRALDAMEGVQSRRALDTVTTMRQTISPFRYRGIGAVAELEARTAAVLRQVA